MVGDNTEGIFLLCVGGLGGIGMGLGPGGQPINANRLSGGGGMSAMGPGGQSPFEILGLNYIQCKVCRVYMPSCNSLSLQANIYPTELHFH